jgi:hypothetical protein
MTMRWKLALNPFANAFANAFGNRMPKAEHL